MRGIEFHPEFIPLIVAGKKLQTRRLVPSEIVARYNEGQDITRQAPKGIPGSHLVIKETLFNQGGTPVYAVDRAPVPTITRWRWKRNHLPNRYMPTEAYRHYLAIVGVRVERLQDISEADAVAEGMFPNWVQDTPGWIPSEHGYLPLGWDTIWEEPDTEVIYCTARDAFMLTWDFINKKIPASTNPLVYVYDFRYEPEKDPAWQS